MKKVMYFFVQIFFGIFFPAFSYADFQIVEVLPNTYNDHEEEYVIIKNISESEKSIEGISLEDATGKQYVFSGSIFAPEEEKKFLRPETKLALNNSNETLILRDSS